MTPRESWEGLVGTDSPDEQSGGKGRHSHCSSNSHSWALAGVPPREMEGHEMEEEVGTVMGQVPKTAGGGPEDSRAGCLPQTMVDPCAQSPCPGTS